MFFDMEAIDKMYEATKDLGCPPPFGIFDKRMLLPLEQLVDAVQTETGEVTTCAFLEAKAKAGWFPLLNGPGPEEGNLGAPLYAPSRIGFLLGLEREGYSPEELRIIAEMEEWCIDNLWASEDLAYEDDDLETVIKFHEDQAIAFEHCAPPDLEKLNKTRKELRVLQSFKECEIPEEVRPKIEKVAFRVRAINEFTRLHMVESDRAKVLAGYSPFVSLSGWSWGSADGFVGKDIRWAETIKAAFTYTRDEDPPSIRVPGVLLRGGKVIPSQTLRPSDYENMWKERDIEGYLQAWAEVHGERRCLNCFAPIESGNDRKKFCSERCRNATKQRRHRERDPEAVARAQQKYWKSCPVEGEG